MELKVKKRVAEAHLPTRTSPGAAGYDLYSCKEVTIPAQGKVNPLINFKKYPELNHELLLQAAHLSKLHITIIRKISLKAS